METEDKELRRLALDFCQMLHETPILFFPFHRKLVRHLTSAILLAYLLRQFQYHKKDVIWDTDERVMKNTSLSRHELHSAKIEVREMGFVSTERKGEKGVTNYTIKWDRIILEIRNSCSPTFGEQEAPDLRLSENRQTLYNILSKRIYVGAATPAPTLTHSHPRWKQMAERLRAAIQKVRKINPVITGWPKSFSMLHTVNGVEIPRIDKVLDWYCKSYPIYQRSEFFPVIECGSSFRKKFGKIEDAMRKTLFGGTPESEKEKHTVIAHVIGKPTMDTRYDDLMQDRK